MTDYTLLAFAGADGIPVVVPVTVGSDDAGGISLSAAVKLPEAAGGPACSATASGLS